MVEGMSDDDLMQLSIIIAEKQEARKVKKINPYPNPFENVPELNDEEYTIQFSENIVCDSLAEVMNGIKESLENSINYG